MTTASSTDHNNKHIHIGSLPSVTHVVPHNHTSSYEHNHKHFHANSTAPPGFHLPHHASTAPNLTTIDSNLSDDEPSFPPHPPNQTPHHSHSLHIASPHPTAIAHAFAHHHQELAYGHDARHAKHDASKSRSSPMPAYVQQPNHLSQEEEIKLFEEQERERKRKEEQLKQDQKNWEEVIKKRERARRTSGAFDDRNSAGGQ